MSLAVNLIGQRSRDVIGRLDKLLTFHFSLDSEDDFCSGCRNVSQSHPKQSFSGLLSPR